MSRDRVGKKMAVRTFLRNNGLCVVMFGLAAVFIVGLSLVGAREHASDEREHGRPAGGYIEYVTSGDFVEAVFENWESEFLQMGCYVLFTIWLVQRGSSESKDPDRQQAFDEDPDRHRDDPDAPGPVRRGGPLLRLYEHSLSAALLTLFLLSSPSTPGAGPGPTARSSRSTAEPPSARPRTSRGPGSGRRPSRTGRASSSRSGCC